MCYRDLLVIEAILKSIPSCAFSIVPSVTGTTTQHIFSLKLLFSHTSKFFVYTIELKMAPLGRVVNKSHFPITGQVSHFL